MRLLAIPQIDRMTEYRKLAEQYSIGFEYNDFFYPDVLDNPEKMQTLLDTYASYNNQYNTLHGAFFDIIVFSYDSKIAAVSCQRVYQSMEVAKQLGCQKVVFHTNLDPNLKQDSYKEHWLERSGAFFSQLADAYPDICICIENMFDDAPEMLKRLMESINKPNVRVCLDMAHAFISPTSIHDWIEELKPWISHIHINDNDGVVDSHKALGQGKIPYESYLDFLQQDDYTVLIEVTKIEDFVDSLDYLRARGVRI